MFLNVNFNDAATGAPYVLRELKHDDEEHAPHLEEIVGRDRVHSFGTLTMEELRTYRIGGAGYAKTAFVMVNGANRVESVIFGHKTILPITSSADLQGDVHRILLEPANTQLNGVPTAIVFYSISTLDESQRGGGARLINNLLAHCPQDMIPATLSPFRTMADAYAGYNPLDFSDEEKLVMAYEHLRYSKDSVQLFHMGNGARIGDVNMNANVPGSLDAIKGWGMMVNFLYTTDGGKLAACKSAFRNAERDSKGRKILGPESFDPELYERIQRSLYLRKGLPRPKYQDSPQVAA